VSGPGAVVYFCYNAVCHRYPEIRTIIEVSGRNTAIMPGNVIAQFVVHAFLLFSYYAENLFNIVHALCGVDRLFKLL
jgi:hypothetical protein